MESEYCVAQIDIDLLIKEVKAHPCLYARKHAKHNDMNHKRIVWDKITRALFPKVWPKYDDEEKADKLEAVQKRWKNLRACFTRELKRQRDPKWVYGVAYKRRKYLYYDALSFLKPECESDEDTPLEIDLPEKTEKDNTIVTIHTDIEEIQIPESTPLLTSEIKTYNSPKEIIINKPESTTDTNTHVNTNKNTNVKANSDPDSTNFALSLVPMLNMIPIEERVAAQIKILSVLEPFIKKCTDEDKKPKLSDGRKKRSIVSKHRKKIDEDVVIEIKNETSSDDD